MRSRNAVLALPTLLAAIASAGRLCAQDPTAFDRACAALQPAAAPNGAAAAQAAPPAAAALADFLRWPASDVRRTRLPAAVALAFAAGDHRVARELAAEARAAQGDRIDGRVVTAELRSLVATGDFERFAKVAQGDSAAGRAPAVATALRADEAALWRGADLLLRSGRRDEALWTFTALAALQPVEAYRLANLGLALRCAGDVDGAQSAYRRALDLGPDDAQLWNDYGLFLRGTGRGAAAVAAFQRSWACESRPGVGPASTNLVLAELRAPGCTGGDPLPAAAQALAAQPDAALLRRAVIDLVLSRPRTRTATAANEPPDNGAFRR